MLFRSRNTNDGISMVQTADGAMEGISDKLQRMRELAVQSANGIYSTSDRAALDIEFQALDDEINRVASSAEFNGTTLLASTKTLTIQVSYADDSTNGKIDVDLTKVTSTGLAVATSSIGTQNASSTAIGSVDDALSVINSARATLGATQNRLETTVTDLKDRKSVV